MKGAGGKCGYIFLFVILLQRGYIVCRGVGVGVLFFIYTTNGLDLIRGEWVCMAFEVHRN